MRQVSERECALLELLLSLDFPGVGRLRAQLPHIVGVESSCPCGCPSVAVHIDRDAAPPAPGRAMLPVELWERQPGLRLLLCRRDDGYLADLECAWPDEQVRPEWPDPADCLVVLRHDDDLRWLGLRLPGGPEVRADPKRPWIEIEWEGDVLRVWTADGQPMTVGPDGRLGTEDR